MEQSRLQTRDVFKPEIKELDETSPRAPDPGGKFPLRPNQLTIIHAAQTLEREQLVLQQEQTRIALRTRMGIIADETGLGKSFEILGLILSDEPANDSGVETHTFGCNRIVLETDHVRPQTNLNVIVVPHSLTQQWCSYIESYTDLGYYLVNTTARYRELFENDQILTNKSIILVTNTFYHCLVLWIQRRNLRVRRVFFDEADNLKITRVDEIPSDFTWFVTASYANLLYPRGFRTWNAENRMFVRFAEGVNSNGFIRNVFNDIFANMPANIMDLLVLKNTREFGSLCFTLPEPEVYHVISNDPGSIHVLVGIVEPQIIDALNAGDIGTAIHFVNPQQRMSEESIIFTIIENFRTRLRNCEIERQAQLERIQTEEERTAHLHNINQRINTYTSNLNTIAGRVKNANLCCICYGEEGIQHKTILHCCGSSFCFQCIHRWLARTPRCPLCNWNVNREEFFVVDESAKQAGIMEAEPEQEPEDNANPPFVSRKYSKMRNLLEILRNRPAGSKFLIFSAYDNTIENIARNLTAQRIHFKYLKGPPNSTNNTVRQYRDETLDVLLVNSNNYGHGMNLQNTTDVIMFHKFNSEIEKQVIGRAQREGRRNPLKIWYLLHQNEYNMTNAS